MTTILFCKTEQMNPLRNMDHSLQARTKAIALYTKIIATILTFETLNNKPFPSSPASLLQNESLCKTFHMKTSLIWVKTNLSAEHIFVWTVSHERLVSTQAKSNSQMPISFRLFQQFERIIHVNSLDISYPVCFLFNAKRCYCAL